MHRNMAYAFSTCTFTFTFTFILVLLPRFPVSQSLNPNYCKCPSLIFRTFITHNFCGDCARCWWDLKYYVDTFKDHDKTLETAPAGVPEKLQGLEANLKRCVEKISYPPSYAMDADLKDPELKPPDDYPYTCKSSLDHCRLYADAVFESQCDTLKVFDDETDKILKPAEDLVSWNRYMGRIMNEIPSASKPLPMFTGSDSHFYFRTCPSHHHKYAFTYYLLFAKAFKKYGVQQRPEGEWDEELWLSEVAEAMFPKNEIALARSAKEVEDLFDMYGVPPLNRRFCGHRDVFICLKRKPKPIVY